MRPRGPLSTFWRAALVLAAVSLVLIFGIPWMARDPAPSDPSGAPRPALDALALESVRHVLAPPVGSGPALPSLVDGIVRIGPTALPVSLALLCGEESFSELSPSTGGAIDPVALELRSKALREAIDRFPAEERARCMTERALGAPLAIQRVLIQWLGDVDHPDALRGLLRIARQVES